jgi:hypothetical protein
MQIGEVDSKRMLEWVHEDGTVFATFIPPWLSNILVTASFDSDRSVTAFSVSPNENTEIDRLYQLYRSLDPLEVARRLTQPNSTDDTGLISLRRFLDEKRSNPLGAVEAALVLLRSRMFGILYGDPIGRDGGQNIDWLANLAEWFPYLGVDAAILVAQRLISDPNGNRAEEARIRSIVGSLCHEPSFPVTDECLLYLLDIMRLAALPNATAIDRVHWIIDDLRLLPLAFDAIAFSSARRDTNGLFAIYSARIGDAFAMTNYKTVLMMYARSVEDG